VSDLADAAVSSLADYSFRRYLAAKTTVDDRALHGPTEARLEAELADISAGRDRETPVRVLEVGAGVGTTLPRLLVRDRLPGRVHYTMLDRERENVEQAREHLRAWGDRSDTPVDRVEADDPADDLRLSHDDGIVTVRFETADAFRFVAERAADEPAYDLLLAQAVLDLLELDTDLPRLLSVVADGGLIYAPITFDGETVFEPTPGDLRDDAVLDLYHATMDASDRPGSSTTGRELLTALPASGCSILSAGASDWVVYPQSGDRRRAVAEGEGVTDGVVGDAERVEDATTDQPPQDATDPEQGGDERSEEPPVPGVTATEIPDVAEQSDTTDESYYLADEAYFCHHIVNTVESAVADVLAGETSVDPTSADLTRADLRTWAETRHRQIESGDLLYLAHNLDLLARVSR
jgi:predicted O-methyltransferase YrrM